LFTYTGTLTDNALTINPIAGAAAAIDMSTPGVVSLVVSPEPASLAMGLLSGLFLLRQRRPSKKPRILSGAFVRLAK
jgi:hypothetical protein